MDPNLKNTIAEAQTDKAANTHESPATAAHDTAHIDTPVPGHRVNDTHPAAAHEPFDQAVLDRLQAELRTIEHLPQYAGDAKTLQTRIAAMTAQR